MTMAIVPGIQEIHGDMTRWRRDLHSHPETAFEEHRTSEFVGQLLGEFGLEVTRGLAGTGVVGTLKGNRPGNRAIALRADMDALHIEERTGLDYRSRNEGRMHACGHDGHTTMLLGAVKCLAADPDFGGTLHFIFQPAEENEGGARVMVEDGLFERFPVEAVYGMHNWPGLEVGRFAVRNGPIMAASDMFEIIVKGSGSHAAMPHLGVDSVLVAAEVVGALQSIVSRNLHPIDSGVVTVTQIHGGDTWNVIPDRIILRGTTRAFKPHVRDAIEPAIRRTVAGICGAYDAEFEITYDRRYPPTVNSPDETAIAIDAAIETVGVEMVETDVEPTMGAEDFAFMLQEKPGCYIFVGNGSDAGGKRLHSPHYDFNDETLTVGASYWINLVRRTLGRAAEDGA
ncbi:MAG: amidohydrolase [Alphaproteobacteria bacterium]|nr:amidohydrolase [Alphaproteobacteria bacterium]